MIDKEWAIVELMGHRKLAGYCTDDGGMLRIDVYDQEPTPKCETCDGFGGFIDVERPADGLAIACGECGGDGTLTVHPLATQWYGAAAVYCITASTKQLCIDVTANHKPAPVGRWELPERVTTGGRLGEDREIDDADPEPDDEDVPW